MNDNTKLIDEQIVNLRKQGMIQKEIAESLSIKRDKVRRVLKKANMENYKHRKHCENCNEEYETTGSHSRFCTDRCRRIHFKSNNGKKQLCKFCLKPFFKYKVQECCSMECKTQYYNKFVKPNREYKEKTPYIPKPKINKTCESCTKDYLTTRSESKFCSESCRYESLRNNREKFNHRCSECSKWFTSTNRVRVYCSKRCSRKNQDRRKEMVRRQRILTNGECDWDISIERLVKRDKGICYLCNAKVNLNLHHNHNEYPSVEHVIPLVKGGTHTWSNVKLAHRICNSYKSDKTIEITLDISQ